MSRTFGHMNRRKGWVSYRSAKVWRSTYNRQLRRANTVVTASDDGNVAYLHVEQVKSGNKQCHPGDLW